MSASGEGSRSGGAAREIGFSVGKGAILIGIAVIIGLLLLRVTDNGGSKSSTAKTSPSTQDTGKASTTSTTSTTIATGPEKAAKDLRVIVLNGGAASGAAKDIAAELKRKGYTNQAEVNNWADKRQTGKSVLCKSGLSREAVALAVAVGQGTQTPAWPDPAPPYTNGPPPVDCVVVIGA